MAGKSLLKRAQERQTKEQAEAALRAAAKEHVLEEWENFCDKADLIILYTLMFTKDFTVEECYDFYRQWQANHFKMIESFRGVDRKSGIFDEGDYEVMERRMTDSGFDFGELKKISDDESAKYEEWRKKKAEEWKKMNEKMTRDEFVKNCVSLGYCKKEIAEEYSAGRDELTFDDYIECFRKAEAERHYSDSGVIISRNAGRIEGGNR